MEAVTRLVEKLRKASEAERVEIKKELVVLAGGADGAHVREAIEQAMKGELLEIKWELEEVLEETTPKKPQPAPAPAQPEKPAQPEAPPQNKGLTAADLQLMYDDPRGLMLYKTKVGDRWFASQVDPRTGQPQTFELHPDEIRQVKAQLQNSPYWVIGSR